MLRYILIALGAVLLGASCGGSPRHATYGSQIQDIGSWMTGSFRCDAPEGGGRAVRLDVIEFWPRHDDAAVLYAEWAYEDALGEPLRQCVYHVQRFNDASAALAVFELVDPQAFAGAWRNPGRLDTLAWEDLIERPACALHLVREGPKRFAGATMGDGCPGSSGGSPITVERLEVTPEGLVWRLEEVGDADPRVSPRGPLGGGYAKVSNRPLR